ncbi:DUF2520 domain-containing protein [Rhodobacteraceae bacterium B1Z28]|uniref:DUF2520 domain-containing protein n=1 Tax=Ruegeria haliotis TaxID=2747601 RepID=A0ABX2PW89_9RHOB|nr:Rossmann-like and DUF2520 domain-containing protein [Ruegeria haliotis]NVO58034.1 DUF2520 domain-containing protein [Ruegeria haliotis]
MSKIKVNVIGAGRVGRTLISLLDAHPQCAVQGVLSRRFASAQNAVQSTAAGRAVASYAEVRSADLWIIAVPDTQISDVATDLAEAFRDRAQNDQTPVAFHCSGFFPAAEMAPLRQLKWQLASVHPVLSFADPDIAKTQFKGSLCGLEGDEDAISCIQPIFEGLGATCFSIHSEGKSLYHAAAVISNNFTVVLQAIAREAWAEAGVPDEIAQQLNAKLLDSTAKNVATLGPQQALTGPAARGDELVVTRQSSYVSHWHPAAGRIYDELSAMAKTLKATAFTR